MRRAKKSWFQVLLIALCTLSLQGLALADSPHFIKASASLNSAGDLVVTFKEVGLGTTVTTATITLTADATAGYFCLNRGGKKPSAGNKETVSGPISGGGTFPVRNGSVSGTITVAPIGPGSFSCPGGQTLTLGYISYSNISLADGTDIASIPSTQCKTLNALDPCP